MLRWLAQCARSCRRGAVARPAGAAVELGGAAPAGRGSMVRPRPRPLSARPITRDIYDPETVTAGPGGPRQCKLARAMRNRAAGHAHTPLALSKAASGVALCDFRPGGPTHGAIESGTSSKFEPQRRRSVCGRHALPTSTCTFTQRTSTENVWLKCTHRQIQAWHDGGSPTLTTLNSVHGILRHDAAGGTGVLGEPTEVFWDD